MRIRTKLYAGAFYPVIIGLVMGVGLLHLFGRLSEATDTSHRMGDIMQETFRLNVLMSEYVLHGGARARDQWLAVHQQMGRALTRVKLRDAADRGILDEIRGQHAKVEGAFLAMATPEARPTAAAGHEAVDREARERQAGQALAMMQAMVSGAGRLDEHSRARVVQLERMATLVALVSIIIMAAGKAVISFLVGHSILGSLRRLRGGMEVVGMGNLDYKVGTDTNDEIGELSRDFDHMTAKLRSITTSRDELNREIEERRKVEERLHEALVELKRSNKDLETFAYVASHDLQEPLRTVSSFTQLLERRYKGKMDQDADEFIAYITDGARRAQVLIADLLEYARVGSKAKPPALTDCSKVMESVLNGLQAAIRDSGACVLCAPLPTVMADAIQIAQVFQNLIANALKFRRDDVPAEVRVGAERHDGMWAFAVKDNGIGIDPEYFGRIFEAFQRLHGAQYPGTGLGLAISKKIIEHHGGTIWVESVKGQGTTFFFTLPATDG